MHSYNGNKNKTHGYTIMHLNKGNALFATKLDDIKICILKNNPDILHIAEANYDFTNSGSHTDFPNYEFIQSELSNIIGYSRNIIMVKTNVKYKRRKDLECYPLSSIWLQIFPPKSKPILLNV